MGDRFIVSEIIINLIYTDPLGIQAQLRFLKGILIEEVKYIAN